jgi:hypothetical protein
MAEAGVVGIGRLTLSRRERMIIVEPRGLGMALFTLRAADEESSRKVISQDTRRFARGATPHGIRQNALRGPQAGDFRSNRGASLSGDEGTTDN